MLAGAEITTEARAAAEPAVESGDGMILNFIPGRAESGEPQMCICTSGNLEIPGSGPADHPGMTNLHFYHDSKIKKSKLLLMSPRSPRRKPRSSLKRLALEIESTRQALLSGRCAEDFGRRLRRVAQSAPTPSKPDFPNSLPASHPRRKSARNRPGASPRCSTRLPMLSLGTPSATRMWWISSTASGAFSTRCG